MLLPPRARIVIRGVDDEIRVRRGRRLLLVNGDIRPQRLVAEDGSEFQLDRPGATCAVRFRRPGIYTLETFGGRCLVPRLNLSRPVATIRITVA
jgi:hypothetical protein